MNWTHGKPTQEGWYWFRMDNEEQRVVIVYVINADRMVSIGHEQEGHPAAQRGAWYGPLEPPLFVCSV